MLVTLIVPVFNTEKYIERCITSLRRQTYQNIEILIIDDYSTDGSAKIIENYIFEDKRIRLIHNEKNMGLSFSRNIGIDKASGDYIMFVDSDDFLELYAVEDLVSYSQKVKSEIIVFGSSTHIGKRIEHHIPKYKEPTITGIDIKNKLFKHIIGSSDNELGKPQIGFAPWAYFIDKAYIDTNNIKFISERKILFEDLQFAFDLYSKANSVSIFEKPLYHYIIRSNSLSNGVTDSKIDLLDILFQKLVDNHFLNDESRIYFSNSIVNYIYFFFQKVDSVNQMKKIRNSLSFKKIVNINKINNYPIKAKIILGLAYFRLFGLLSVIIKVKNKERSNDFI